MLVLVLRSGCVRFFFFFFKAEDGIRDVAVTGVQTCALPISDAVAGGLEDRRQDRGHRALAVRAPDLGEPVAPLGVTQRREQPLDPFEPGAHPGVLAAAQGEQASDRLSVGHGGPGGRPARTPGAKGPPPAAPPPTPRRWVQ